MGESILRGSGAFIVRVKDIFHLLTVLGVKNYSKMPTLFWTCRPVNVY